MPVSLIFLKKKQDLVRKMNQDKVFDYSKKSSGHLLPLYAWSIVTQNLPTTRWNLVELEKEPNKLFQVYDDDVDDDVDNEKKRDNDKM